MERHDFKTPNAILELPDDLNGYDASEGKPFIDLDRFRIRWKGKECPLRNGKPFQLFDRLNSRPGTYIRVEDLIDELWSENEVERNTVQQAASRLQRLLREAGMNDLIIDGRTNPGFYALVIN